MATGDSGKDVQRPDDARSIEAFDPARLSRFMARAGHGGHLGLVYSDHGEDWVELAFDWRPELVGDTETGVIASGPVITLMDNAMSLAIWTKLRVFRPHATMDLRIDYLRPSPPGARVIGRGECYRLTHNIGFVRGMAHNGDPADPIAHTAATFIRTQARP